VQWKKVIHASFHLGRKANVAFHVIGFRLHYYKGKWTWNIRTSCGVVERFFPHRNSASLFHFLWSLSFSRWVLQYREKFLSSGYLFNKKTKKTLE